MNIDHLLRLEIEDAVAALFGQAAPVLQIQPTNQEFEGSHTLVCFPLTKLSKKGPEETGSVIGEKLVGNGKLVSKFNVVKGFLNLSISDEAWVKVLADMLATATYGQQAPNGKEIMVEYSSPNTNKPLHLGHLRNNFLGYSVAEIYRAVGYTVHKVQIINDRGIHICKSMAAWTLFGNGETPEGSGLKGDKLVGKYYVEFDKAYKAQVKELEGKGMTTEQAEKEAPIMKMAVDLLLKWEARDPETLKLWKMMNSWVYAGFDATYRRMGVDFEKLYYESDTYLLGKEEVMKGLAAGVFFRKDDGSVWVDLTGDGLDQKVLLRADGTSVYMTQDIGTAMLRFRDFPKIEGQVYTVGNEQEYHFKVLFLILGKLGYAWAKKCYHLSYGMVDLPSGKMKSREGTVVDADDLMEEMVSDAAAQTAELGKTEGMSKEEVDTLTEMIGLGALKYFLLKVDPKKRMLFDPSESISLQGHTGPFIQYTHARIRGMLRKANLTTGDRLPVTGDRWELHELERNVIVRLSQFPSKLEDAAREYSPAVIANYIYTLAQDYNQFYQAIPVLNEPDSDRRAFRLAFSGATADVIRSGMRVLGIGVPDRM
ncbi:MAG: arginine--tRNA ligase [Cyclobacteriaceae bacterium]|nr:arginine--tRNA ligase [Cyclobacteriaceae bacterium]